MIVGDCSAAKPAAQTPTGKVNCKGEKGRIK